MHGESRQQSPRQSQRQVRDKVADLLRTQITGRLSPLHATNVRNGCNAYTTERQRHIRAGKTYFFKI